MQGENFESDSKKEVDSIEKTQSAHEKVNYWLLEGKLIESAQGLYKISPTKNGYVLAKFFVRLPQYFVFLELKR
ncbi:hypothetical protein JTB14_027473 [Gonioctena quinquepunctata]|nr:hypothetical protein JTB14_027473 [Gonioctena quinquepunctata]